MRNIMVGFAVLGALAVGTGVPATAHPLSVPPAVVHLSNVEQIHWDGCGPRCWEHRQWERERAWEHHRWARHQRWEEHRRWEDSRRYPPAYGYAPRY